MDYPGLDWTILARQPIDVAFAPVQQLLLYIWAIGIAFTLLIACIGWFIAGRVIAPLKEITYAADQLSAGATIEIPQHKGIRDIEILSSSLQTLINSLTKTTTALDHMETLAHSDRLTGLPNRMALVLKSLMTPMGIAQGISYYRM